MKLTWANKITIMRILLIVPFIMCMIKANVPEYGTTLRYVAVGLFLVMSFSDALDGYLARVKKQVTRLGSFLDPMADKLLMTCACVLLAYEQTAVPCFRLPKEVAVLIIGKDVLLLLGFIVLYLMTGQVHVLPNIVGKVATVLQLSMVAGVLIAPEMTAVMPAWEGFIKVLWWSAAAVAVVATVLNMREGKRFVESQENGSENHDNV